MDLTKYTEWFMVSAGAIALVVIMINIKSCFEHTNTLKQKALIECYKAKKDPLVCKESVRVLRN